VAAHQGREGGLVAGRQEARQELAVALRRGQGQPEVSEGLA
jgi:hypothetical protein